MRDDAASTAAVAPTLGDPPPLARARIAETMASE